MERHILSILVKNHSGVLSRVSGLFSRRGYNIDSLTVGVTEDPTLSRMTISVYTDKEEVIQIKNQVAKIIDVVKVVELFPGTSVFREFVLIKVSAAPEKRAEITNIVDIFRASIVDVATNSLIIQITGDEPKIQAITSMLEPYGIKEIVRTGVSAICRGENELKKVKQ
ncbi:MAG: acetolactate synthase small subunit [Anaeroplasmataceae bacterium]